MEGQESASSATAMHQRARLDPHADPTAPSCGTPRFPYISTQLRKAFSTFAPAIVQTIGATFPMACKLWRSTTKAKNGNIPRIDPIA